ncbi:MAG: hypothetical protein ACO1RA_09610 [Planctomycetaceae bacterium]
MNSKAQEIVVEILAELRGIVRIHEDLKTPVARFLKLNSENRYYVDFDTRPHRVINGLKVGGIAHLSLPDERITDCVLDLAKAIWHLKDRLHQLSKATKAGLNLDDIARQSTELLIAGDLANKKKHGRSDNRSRLNPELSLVKFDTSRSGEIEFYYDGVMKDKELIVANPIPIPFSVDILVRADKEVYGDASAVLFQAFKWWLPTIERLGVFEQESAKAIRDRLLP